MIKAWVLLILMSTGELQAYPMENELACEAERIEIIALASRHDICPEALDARCMEAFVTDEALEGGE